MNNQHQKRCKLAFWSAFWAALGGASADANAAELPSITRIEVPNISPRDAMRGDWVRIGEDFGRVIAREEAATRPH